MSLTKKVEALRQLTLFAGFELEALRLLAFAAPQTEFDVGKIVYSRGDPLKAGHLLLSGTILLVADDGGVEKGKVVGPGSLIGARSLLTESIAVNTAIAQEKSVTMTISHDLFLRVLNEFPTSAAAMRNLLVQEIETFGAEVKRARKILLTPKL